MATISDNSIEQGVHSAIRQGALSRGTADDVRAAGIRVNQIVAKGIYATAEERAECISKLNYVRGVARILIGDQAVIAADCCSWPDVRLCDPEIQFIDALRTGATITADPVPVRHVAPAVAASAKVETPAAAATPAVSVPTVTSATPAADDKPKAITPIPVAATKPASESGTMFSAWQQEKSSGKESLSDDDRKRFRSGVRAAVQTGSIKEARARGFLKTGSVFLNPSSSEKVKLEAIHHVSPLCMAADSKLYYRIGVSNNRHQMRIAAAETCMDELSKVVAEFEKVR
jgi:hypothetical protein